jgi:hypothetical protein
VVVRERSLSLPVCGVTRVKHSALSAYSRPEVLDRRYINPQIYLFIFLFYFLQGMVSLKSSWFIKGPGAVSGSFHPRLWIMRRAFRLLAKSALCIRGKELLISK